MHISSRSQTLGVIRVALHCLVPSFRATYLKQPVQNALYAMSDEKCVSTGDAVSFSKEDAMMR